MGQNPWLPDRCVADERPHQQPPAASVAADPPIIIRGQSPGYGSDPLPGGYSRGPQAVSGGPAVPAYPGLSSAPPAAQPGYGAPQPPAFGPPQGAPQPYGQPAAAPPQFGQPYP